jgi:hypothetical protein
VDNAVVLLLLGLIGLIMLFAQLKLFSIDSTLREIRDIMKKKGEE